jgi:hypothetical protein
MEGEPTLVKELMEKHALPILLREFSLISDYSQLSKASLLLQVLSSMAVDAGVMQQLPGLLRNAALTFLLCDTADFSVGFTKDSRGHLAACFTALMPIYKSYGSDDDICSLLEAFDCPEIRTQALNKPPVIQAYTLEFTREFLKAKLCEVEELTQVKRLSDALFSRFYFINEDRSAHPLHVEVQEEANASHHMNIRLLLQCPAALSVTAALEQSFDLADPSYVSRLSSFLNYFLSSSTYFTTAAKRGDFIVKLASAADVQEESLQVLGLCLQKADLANELDKIRELYVKLLRSELHFDFANSNLTRVFRMMDSHSSIFEDFELVFSETEDPVRLIDMTQCISGVIETCEKPATKLRLQEAYIRTLPVALILSHWRTRHVGLPKALGMLVRSLLHNNLNRLEQTKLLSAALRSYLGTYKSAAASCLEDLLLTIFGAETLDLTSEVSLPELIDCFLELLASSRDNSLAMRMLRLIEDLCKKSLNNISCFSRFGGRLLELAESEGCRTEALSLLTLCGSYYFWPGVLLKFIDKLYESLLTGDQDSSASLLAAIIPMSSNARRPFKLSSLKGKRSLPLHSLHFRTSDSVFTSSLVGLFDKGLTVSCWVYPQVPGALVTLLDNSLKIILIMTANYKLEILVVKGGLAVSFPDLAGVSLNEWSFISLTVTLQYVSLHVNSRTMATEEMRCAFNDVLSINLGSCYACNNFQPSFKGEVANLYVFKGNLTEEILASLHLSGFEGLDFLTQFKQSYTWYEDYPEPQRRNLEALKSMVSHYLNLTSCQPKCTSVDAAILHSPTRVPGSSKLGSSQDRSPRLTTSNVDICSGPMLIEAFHQIGGLKVWLFVMHEISTSEQKSSLEMAFKLLKNLLEQENLQTASEVCKDNLFDLLCALMKKWKETGLSLPFNLSTECAEISWLYKKSLNVLDIKTEALFESYRRHPGALRLVLSFKLWRDLDQSRYFEVVTGLSEVMSHCEGSSALHMHLLEYYMSLARHSPAALEALRLKYQDKLFKTLRSHMNLRSLLMLLLYERSLSLSSAAIQLVLELTGSFAVSEFSEYINHSSKRLRSLLKNIYDLTVMLANTPDTADCLRYVGFTVEKLFSLSVSSMKTFNRSEVPALSLCEELVFKLAEVSAQRDTIRLLEHFVEQCQACRIAYDFGRLLKIYYECWSKTKDMETLRFTAEILAQQFSGPLDRDYERLYVTCEEVLKVSPQFAEFVLSLMMCLASSHINSHIFQLLLYWAEDLQKHLGVQVPAALLQRLLSLAIAEGVQHEATPVIPRFSWSSPILVETRRPKVTSFATREGGTLRILLSLSIRAMLTEPPEVCVQLIRDLLDIRIPESYLRLKYTGVPDTSADFFAEDLNVVAYIAGELLELLCVRSELRVAEVYSLVLDLLLANGNNLLNCLDLLLNADLKFNEFLLQHFSKISGGVAQWARVVILYQASRGPLTKDDQLSMRRLEGKLKEIARKLQFDIFEADLLDRSSTLARLHDFLVAYACLRVKAVEQVKPVYGVTGPKKRKFYSKKYLPTANEQAIEQLFYENSRHNKNMQDYGATRLKQLLADLTLEFQLNSSYYTPQFWRISPVVDALGRKMRLVPFAKGSNYHDKVNALYLQPQLDKASLEEILSLHSNPQGSCFNRRSTIPSVVKTDLAHSLYKEQLENSINPHAPPDNLAKSVTVDCEYIRIDCVIYGEVEVSADCLVFRSTGKARPPQYDLASLNGSLKQTRKVKIWLAREVVEVVNKKYMQQRTAVEVYTSSGRSYLLNLYSISAVRKLMHFFGGKFKTSTLESVQPWMKLWKAGQLSNMEYLLKLNKYAGRSYHDLGQYPVFPWVLANYDSQLTLDEHDFRDLSWPIGAVEPRCREECRIRYEEFEGDVERMPYHYGSHYSNIGIIVHYLLRAEPYTQQAISFQDNHFDVADRLFYSVKVAWENSTLSPGDYKELIPEFFSVPEFLLNLHQYNLGMRQSGEVVSHVELPTWADSGDAMSAHRFVFWHRRALEHSGVSRSLNKWIDLIFGCKHEDKASVNVFLPLTYEHHFKEQLSLCDAEHYPRETLLIQIAHFGQAPSRIFDKPHETKALERREGFIFKDFDAASITEEGSPAKFKKSTSATISGNSEGVSVTAILRRRTKCCVIYEQDNKLFAFLNDESQSDWLKQLCSFPGCELENVVKSPFGVLGGCFALTEGRVLIASSFADCSFRFYNFNGKTELSLREAVHFHSALVTCLHDSDDNVLATADQEGVVAVWDLDFNGSVLCSLRGVLRTQSVGIRQVTISQPLQLVLSLNFEGCVFLHDLRSCELFNVLRPDCTPSCAAISSLGMIAVGVQDEVPIVQLYSFNGSQCRAPLKTISGSQDSRDRGDKVKWLQFNSAGDYLMSVGACTFSIWPVYEAVPAFVYSSGIVNAVSIDSEERQVLLHCREFVLLRRA